MSVLPCDLLRRAWSALAHSDLLRATGAVLFDCGRITCDAGTTFGNGAVLPIGIETGGRPVRIYAEMDVEQALAVARPCGATDLREGLDALAAEYAGGAAAGRGLIGR